MTRINEDESRLPDETSIETESTTTKPETPEAKAAREKKETLLAKARRQFRTTAAAMAHWRTESLDDARFRAGTWGKKTFQWTDSIREKREDEGRPCLTVNRMPTFIRQVTNVVRQSHYRILAKPRDNKADPKLAETIQGMIRNVEVYSYSDRVYNMAVDKQAEGGLGWIRLITEYVADDGDDADLFRQRVRMLRERRPLSVYPDLGADNPDFTDGKFLFKVADHDAETYEEITGKKPPIATQTTFSTDGDQTGDWFPGGKYRIAEWFCLEPKGSRKRKALLTSGNVIDLPADDTEAQAVRDKQKTDGDPVLRDRWVQPMVMMWRKITADDILEETEWGAKGTQFFGVPGDELEIDGERDWRGVVRDSKESGRIYNVETSALVEAVGTGTDASLVGYTGQFGAVDSETRKQWEGHQRRRFREVDAVDIDGKSAPIPQMVSFEPPIGGIVEAIHQSDQDYKTTAGFHEASLAEQGPQESGRAVLARQRQDELGSSHYSDNLRLTMCSVGRSMIELFRVVYDVATVVRITGNDDRERKVMIFSGAENDPRQDQFLQTHPGPDPMPHPDGTSAPIQAGGKIPFQLPKGVKEIYDISVGEFDIEVTTGKDSGTRRQESVDMMGEIFKALPPEIAAKFIDLWFLMMDFPMAHQMAERAKTLLPPELQDDENGEDMPPQAKAKLAQAKQMLDALMKELQQLKQEQAAKELEQKTKIIITDKNNASKERIADKKEQSALIQTEAEIAADRALADIQAQLETFKTTLTLLHEQRMAGQTRAHEAVQGAHDRAHDIAKTLASTPPPGPEIPDEPIAGATE